MADDPMAGKVSFDDVYDQPDPRAYYRALEGLEYQIPEHARPVFAHLARTVRKRASDAACSVLDLCCSYGINAALLNHDLTLDALYDRYRAGTLDALTSDELVAADRAFFAERRTDPVPVLGLDAASNAVDYAVRAGLLAGGSSENLEDDDPGDELERGLADVRLITVTGGIGYITEATFDRVLGATPAEPPWVAAFVLRWVDMRPIGAVLARNRLALEVLPDRTFRQRRFAHDGERAHALAQLRQLGLDPEGVETDGYHHAALYVARPAAESATPLDEHLAPAFS